MDTGIHLRPKILTIMNRFKKIIHKPILSIGLILAYWTVFWLSGVGLLHAQSKDFIIIGPGGGRQVPLAVGAFRDLSATPSETPLGLKITQVVIDDLQSTGLFRILDPSIFLEDPQSSGITPEQTDFRSWSAIGAEALIKGGFRINGDRLEVEARLFEVIRNGIVVGKKYTGAPEDFRRIAHNFANEVIRFFTGTPGAFNTRIAFVSRRRGKKEIFLMDYDGYKPRQITRDGSINLKPAWSPDGQKLAYTSYRLHRPSVFIADLSGKGNRLRRLPLKADLATGAVWSPNGSQIAIALSQRGNTDLHILGPQGKKSIRRVTSHFGIDVDPAWSPDGKTLAFTSNRSGTPQIYLVDISGKNLRRITFKGRYNTSPVWSPKGDLIVFNGIRKGVFKLFSIKPDGASLRRLTALRGNQSEPSWSPDGRFLTFALERGGKSSVYLLNIATGWWRKLGRGESPAWSPRMKNS